MQLKKVHIDGFGIFNDKQIDGFTSGVNLLYGPNEFGKTTFLEFIRRVLFGFPARRGNINQYPALHGGRYGGKLFCELNNGDELSIHRTEGSHGGPVTIQLGTSEYTGVVALEPVTSLPKAYLLSGTKSFPSNNFNPRDFATS